jgi:hypothetical protein
LNIPNNDNVTVEFGKTDPPAITIVEPPVEPDVLDFIKGLHPSMSFTMCICTRGGSGRWHYPPIINFTRNSQ